MPRPGTRVGGTAIRTKGLILPAGGRRTGARRRAGIGHRVGCAGIVMCGIALALPLAGCGSTSTSTAPDLAAVQTAADTYAVEQIEVTWHHASSTKNVDEMMSIWADDATFTIAGTVYTGKDQIRNFFATRAGPFKPNNHWLSDTPAYKIKVTVDGDGGTLYFECHYVDVATRQVVSVVGADMTVQRINGKWLITKSVSATPVLSP